MRRLSILVLLSLAAISAAQRWPGGFGFVGPAGNTISLNNGAVSLNFGTNAIPSNIKVVVLPNPLVPEPSAYIPETAYAITPAGLYFNNTVQLTIKYNPKALAPNQAAASLRMYRIVNHRWVSVPSSVDTVEHSVTGTIPGMGTYGIVASNLSAIPSEDRILYRYPWEGKSLFMRLRTGTPPGTPEEISWWHTSTPISHLNGTENALYFFRKHGAGHDLYRSNIDGSDVERLTSLNIPFYYRGPNTSGDGKYVVFSTEVGGVWRVLRFNADGSAKFQIAEGGTSSEPIFTPNGAGVLFSDNGIIQIRSLAGAQLGGSPINTGLSGAGDLAINLQGTLIAFAGFPTGQFPAIYTVGFNGTGLTKRSSGNNDRQPSFHPTGSHILFMRNEGNSTERGLGYISASAVNSNPTQQLSVPPVTSLLFQWR